MAHAAATPLALHADPTPSAPPPSKLNSSCRGCRVSRVRCDLKSSSATCARCSRCARLGMLCVLEPRRPASLRSMRSSARSRVGVKNRPLLVGEPFTLAPLAPAAAGERSVWFPPLDEALDLLDCWPLDPSLDAHVAPHLIHTATLLARHYDHCGLMSKALSWAQRVGLKLSSLAGPAAPADAALLQLRLDELRPPQCALELWSARTPCVLRALTERKFVIRPNAMFEARVADAAVLNQSFFQIVGYIHARDRVSIVRLAVQALTAPRTLADDGMAEFAEVRGERPVRLLCHVASRREPVLHRLRVRYVRVSSISYLVVQFLPCEDGADPSDEACGGAPFEATPSAGWTEVGVPFEEELAEMVDVLSAEEAIAMLDGSEPLPS
ncbi:hypothetical protein AB1Y20_006669 [Prymnesium parvum]|uniref:Zn(2)-C6 fungal-type domain-containing protein n=1 Tax=Prymnesium parvum TaxID=97485 RepID=A0AB34IYF7_PRYPA